MIISSILFADIKSFTNLFFLITPQVLVPMLNELVSRFNSLAKYEHEKNIKQQQQRQQ